MKFEETYLDDNILDALYDMRFEECTPIQEKCIPEILDYHDVMGVAQTGTGKTAAYLLPILSMLDEGDYPRSAINCVIMSPTRELAQQIDQAMQGFGYYLNGVSSVAVYGGNDGSRYDQEIKSLRMGADVVIATPGRLISHIKMGNVDLSKVSFFVLDEADRMLDMGFSEDIMRIAKELPDNRQTIMFSATMPDKIQKLAKSIMHDPVEIKLAVSKPAEKIRQSAFICYESQKIGIIKHLFKSNQLKRVIIFSGKKDKVKDITRELKRLHINCCQMHSDLTQQERDEVMFEFKSGKCDVLVATDIVARGIDIDDIQMVINYDVPHDVEDYVHRIGRTARADRDGVAMTMVNEDDMYKFSQIENFLEKTIQKNPLPEELGEGPEYKAERRRGPRGNGRGSNKKSSKAPRRDKGASTSAGSSSRRRHNSGKNSTGNTAVNGDAKTNSGAMSNGNDNGNTQPEGTANAANKNKRRRRRPQRHRRKGNPSGETSTSSAKTSTSE